MARPKAKIDMVELEKLCGMQCTDEEIAAWFGVCTRTIERLRKTAKFREVMDQSRAKGRVSVRRSLFKMAAGGNIAAAIFLAKNCDHLEAVSYGHIRNLLINVPPRHMKSLLVSVLWPAWEWTRWPERRWLFSSYAATLSIRDSVKCRRLKLPKWGRAAEQRPQATARTGGEAKKERKPGGAKKTRLLARGRFFFLARGGLPPNFWVRDHDVFR